MFDRIKMCLNKNKKHKKNRGSLAKGKVISSHKLQNRNDLSSAKNNREIISVERINNSIVSTLNTQ